MRIKLKETNLLYALLIFITFSPFIHSTYIFIFLEFLCIFCFYLLNKKIFFFKTKSCLRFFYIIPLFIILFSHFNISAIGQGIKIFLAIVIIMQLKDKKLCYEISKKFFLKLAFILIVSILFEKFFTNFFFDIFKPIFTLLIGAEGSEMIYQNATIVGVYYGLFPDAATSCILLIIPLAFIFNKIKFNYKDCIMVFMIFICLMITSKRGPFIFAFFTSLFLFCHDENNKFNKKRLLIICIGLLFFMGTLIYIFPYLDKDVGLGRLMNTVLNISNSDMNITSGRSNLSNFALNIFYDHKLLGVGWGQFSKLYFLSTYRNVLNVHNVYIQLLCETGIFGTIFILSPFLISLVLLMKDTTLILFKRGALFILIFNLFYMFSGCLFDMPLYYFSLLLFLYFPIARSETV